MGCIFLSEILTFLTGGGCLAGRVAAQEALAALEIVNDQLAYHDGGIDSAEIQAAYENLITTVNCIVQIGETLGNVKETINAVQITVAKVKDAVDEVKETLDEVQMTVEEIKDLVECLKCPFQTTGLDQVSHGQGCDGVDQNCDGVVDECAEDQMPLEICLNKDLSKPFCSIEEAVALS